MTPDRSLKPICSAQSRCRPVTHVGDVAFVFGRKCLLGRAACLPNWMVGDLDTADRRAQRASRQTVPSGYEHRRRGAFA